MSFIKYAEDQNIVRGNGRGPLHFGRAHVDGLPFRGKAVMLRDDEYDEYTETVYDAQVELFDLAVPAEQQRLTEIIDRVANGWYRILRFDHHWYQQSDGEPAVKIFVMWVVANRELAKHKLPPGLHPSGPMALSLFPGGQDDTQRPY